MPEFYNIVDLFHPSSSSLPFSQILMGSGEVNYFHLVLSLVTFNPNEKINDKSTK